MRLEKALNNSNSNRILLLKFVSSPGKDEENKKGTIIEICLIT